MQIICEAIFYLPKKSNRILDDKEIFPDFVHGPLTKYRKLSSFDWKKLKLVLWDEELLEHNYNILRFLRDDPILSDTYYNDRTLDEQVHLSYKKMFILQNSSFYTEESVSGLKYQLEKLT